MDCKLARQGEFWDGSSSNIRMERSLLVGEATGASGRLMAKYDLSYSCISSKDKLIFFFHFRSSLRSIDFS